MSKAKVEHPVVTRWACNRYWSQSPYLVLEIQFTETPKQLQLVKTDENQKNARTALGYGSHFSKDNRDLHLTREDAINHRRERLRAEIDSLNKKMKTCAGRSRKSTAYDFPA